MTATYSIRCPNYLGGHRELLATFRQDPALRIDLELEPNDRARRNPKDLGTNGFISTEAGEEPPASLDAGSYVVQQAHEVIVVHVQGHVCLPVEYRQRCQCSPSSVRAA